MYRQYDVVVRVMVAAFDALIVNDTRMGLSIAASTVLCRIADVVCFCLVLIYDGDPKVLLTCVSCDVLAPTAFFRNESFHSYQTGVWSYRFS